MNTIIQQMLRHYEINTITEKKNAMKEIMQEMVLCGLSRAGFFKKAAFYGGTALRIFYGLNRFSEDLDFSLVTSDPDFRLEEYFPILSKEIQSFGLQVELQTKTKSTDSQIQSAFFKGDTIQHLLLFYPTHEIEGIPKNELIKIKFEIDINPPLYAAFEHRYRLLPAPYEIRLYDAPSLFAGKIHAVLCRGWKNRVKGRDLYDFIFYISQNTPVHLKHLKERLVQTHHLEQNSPFTLEDLKQMLNQRFDVIDYELAKQDVLPFIKDIQSLQFWNRDFFRQITSMIQAAEDSQQ